MSATEWILASTLATAALTIIMVGSQQLGWTRMSFTLMLGTIVTPNRDRATVIGSGMHLVLGLLFGALYAAYFEWLGAAWWIGAIGGAIHGMLVLLVAFPMLPGIHPRMATISRGPEPTSGLEPPGPLGINYGTSTAIFTFLGHVAFGAVMGALYPVG